MRSGVGVRGMGHQEGGVGGGRRNKEEEQEKEGMEKGGDKKR